MSPAFKQIASLLQEIFIATEFSPWAEISTSDGTRRLLFELKVDGKSAYREYAIKDILNNEEVKIFCYGIKDFQYMESPAFYGLEEEGKLYEMVKMGNDWEYRRRYDVVLASLDGLAACKFSYLASKEEGDLLNFNKARDAAIEQAIKNNEPIVKYIQTNEYLCNVIKMKYRKEV